MKRSALAAIAALISFPLSAAGSPHRGVWFWNNTTVDGVVSPHSSSNVVGNPALEDNAIVFLNCHSVKEVYGSYSTRPVDDAADIRDWNVKLHAAGIESQLLISGPDPDSPGTLTDPTHASWVNKVNQRLIAFNLGSVGTAQMFDALHLDLEPQGLDDWKLASTTALDRRAYLDDLLDAYIDIRAALDTGGFPSMPIYADLPWNWDKMPAPDPADGKVGWASTADRDAWYAAVAGVIDGISIMTFTSVKDTVPEIADATDYERSGLFSGAARIAIQPKVGPGKIWPTYPTFTSVLGGLESAYGPSVDLENYAFWRHAYADYGPTIGSCFPWISAAADPEIFKPAGGGGPFVIFTGSAGYLYQVKHSSDLHGDYGQAIHVRTRGDERERMRVPVQLTGKRGFWVIEEEPELPSS